MSVFAFTQIFFSPIYKFDSKILLLPPVHAQKCDVCLMCGKQSICFTISVQLQEGGNYHSAALMSCCAHRQVPSLHLLRNES